MGRPTRPETDALIAEVLNKPYHYEFFAIGRLLQAWNSHLPRLGYSLSPSQDAVRFGQNPVLTFAPSTIESVERLAGGDVLRVFTRHFGLFGPHGPLPTCLTEHAQDRLRHYGDGTFAAFCNVFHHRLLCFFYRAWADAQKTVDLDRADERWTHFMRCLIGMGLAGFADRDSVPDRSKLFFTGRLVHQSRNAGGLAAIIQDFFGVPAEVQSFVGQWLDLPEESTCRLGASPHTGAVGLTLIVGARFWTCQLHFRVHLGPMSLEDYERLLPCGDSFRRLCDWIRQYAGLELSWDARLVLHKDKVPPVQIGRAGRLGWTTWLKTKPFEHHADSLILTEHAN